ncbi:MAG TPA: glycosyltransferase family 9 protein, partial [Verrucomicrobiae bacterium]
MKAKLLIVELWGLGDLVIATPFIRAASEKFEVTLLAKPFAAEMRARLWPAATVIPFTAPWTAFRFRSKYSLWRWPWREMLQLRHKLRAQHFDCGLSARWDPRDHFLLHSAGARERLGFPRLKSGRYLTTSLERPAPLAHRAEYWRTAGAALGLAIPSRDKLAPPSRPPSPLVFIHSGARLPARVWPLENFRQIAARFRAKKIPVQIACDADQREWWARQGEDVACPQTVNELFSLVDRAGVFVGNCSGPGHLAAI